ncbi:TIGR04283 family arsenosugar biosynthesis glycosyltransferase [Salidesulfovibrio onnuriiensis]|uniref:TIGR04283 family arsenosugar biosynthesis glycosyltransferase n=1 Tax=Salidesulfovibrio onnuriiensis TaxID=2583823 RepID=UPI0011C9BBE7|nr:TIGR04283 family arsenosugar biosynthesis glycosyltransferase [Salidesulfovibrio onnuriiensis]
MQGKTTGKGEKIPLISVIVPVWNEQRGINSLVRHVRELARGLDVEILVADGHPDATTLAALDEPAVIRVRAPQGRAVQMNAGAAGATGDILLFLHADTRLPGDAFRKVAGAVALGFRAGAFDLAIDSGHPWLWLVARVASLRSRLERLPYGDQAHFFDAGYFRELGGYAEIPIMEDVELFRRVRRAGERIRILPDRAVTSARRWEKEGMLQRTLANWWLRLRYALGADPEDLAGRYRPHSENTERT